MGTRLLCVLAAAGLMCGALLANSIASGATVRPDAVPLSGRPNIVLITIDALRADHLTSYGYGRFTSPAIDAFARDAVRFDQAIAQAPYTKASVASLMTGLYPTTHKTTTSTVPFPEVMTGYPTTRPIPTDVLPRSATTLAEALRGAGYRTYGFTANPFLTEAFGFARGFDLFRFYPGQDFSGANHVVSDALEAIRTTDRSQPLFLWVHLMEPHSPYAPPPWTSGLFKVSGAREPIGPDVSIPFWLLPGTPRDLRPYLAAYDDEIAAADVGVDTLLRGFRSLRMQRNRVIVVTADHGEQFLDHGGWEHSTNLYDELIRVPLLVQAPGVKPGVVSTQVQLIDLFPTLLAFAGAEAPSTSGHSLVRLLSRAEDARPALSEIVGSQSALRYDGWKLIASDAGRAALFDLVKDPGERHDRAAAEPARTARMQAWLDQMLASAVRRASEIPGERALIDPAVANRLRSLGYVRP
jgi:choline-sulfatase